MFPFLEYNFKICQSNVSNLWLIKWLEYHEPSIFVNWGVGLKVIVFISNLHLVVMNDWLEQKMVCHGTVSLNKIHFLYNIF
jgi:hypothetical protein